jgi:hypothetical protein
MGEIRKWVGRLPTGEKDDLIARFIKGEEPALAIELMRRFIEEKDKRSRGEAEDVKRRTVGEILQAAEERTEKRRCSPPEKPPKRKGGVRERRRSRERSTSTG